MSQPSGNNPQGHTSQSSSASGGATGASLVLNSHKLINFVPTYDGDATTIYNYITSSNQWLNLSGKNPGNVMLLLSKLSGKAALTISMLNHNFDWDLIVGALKSECGDNRGLNSLLTELSNLKRKGTYKEFIFELKQKLFFIKSKLADKYENKASIVEEVMEPYIDMAQNTLRNSLPYHDQHISKITTVQNELNSKIVLLTNSKFKQKYALTLLFQAQTLQDMAERLTTAITFAEHHMYHYSINNHMFYKKHLIRLILKS